MYIDVFLLAFVFRVLLALIPANIAKQKGRNFVQWWAYGFFLWIIAVIHATCLSVPEPEIRYVSSRYGMNAGEQSTAESITAEMKHNSGSVSETKADTVVFESRKLERISCPVCHKSQMTNRDTCFSCGTIFVYADEQTELIGT